MLAARQEWRTSFILLGSRPYIEARRSLASAPDLARSIHKMLGPQHADDLPSTNAMTCPRPRKTIADLILAGVKVDIRGWHGALSPCGQGTAVANRPADRPVLRGAVVTQLSTRRLGCTGIRLKPRVKRNASSPELQGVTFNEVR
jgi:hypothetical protein